MADSKITALTALTAADPANDMIPIVDVSDTPPASGNTKRISINNILACSPSATLASATISGDLTVATNRLSVSSTGVQIGTTTNKTTAFTGNGTGLTIGAALAPTIALWDTTNASYVGSISQIDADMYLTNTGAGQMVFSTDNTSRYTISSTGISTWSVGGSTAMTLNSTGLGIGIAPSNSKLSVYGTGDQIDETATLSVGNTTAGGMRLYAGVNNTNEYVYIGSVKSGSGYRTLKLQPNGGNAIICLSITPPTLTVGGDMVFNLTSNTNLRISVRGTDGTTRVANITLA